MAVRRLLEQHGQTTVGRDSNVDVVNIDVGLGSNEQFPLLTGRTQKKKRMVEDQHEIMNAPRDAAQAAQALRGSLASASGLATRLPPPVQPLMGHRGPGTITPASGRSTEMFTIGTPDRQAENNVLPIGSSIRSTSEPPPWAMSGLPPLAGVPDHDGSGARGAPDEVLSASSSRPRPLSKPQRSGSPAPKSSTEQNLSGPTFGSMLDNVYAQIKEISAWTRAQFDKQEDQFDRLGDADRLLMNVQTANGRRPHQA